jgi:xylulokinase
MLFCFALFRAIIEGQFLSMLLHSQNLGLKVSGRVICTGGASKNKDILQVVSDVFGVPVFVGVNTLLFD